jgi:hypothetical protein
MSISKDEIRDVYEKLRDQMKRQFGRTVSFADYFTDRWERARYEGLARAPVSMTTCSYWEMLELPGIRALAPT